MYSITILARVPSRFFNTYQCLPPHCLTLSKTVEKKAVFDVMHDPTQPDEVYKVRKRRFGHHGFVRCHMIKNTEGHLRTVHTIKYAHRTFWGCSVQCFVCQTVAQHNDSCAVTKNWLGSWNLKYHLPINMIKQHLFPMDFSLPENFLSPSRY